LQAAVPFLLQLARRERVHRHVVERLATERPEISPVTIRSVALAEQTAKQSNAAGSYQQRSHDVQRRSR
jgi:hypothetical protein